MKRISIVVLFADAGRATSTNVFGDVVRLLTNVWVLRVFQVPEEDGFHWTTKLAPEAFPSMSCPQRYCKWMFTMPAVLRPDLVVVHPSRRRRYPLAFSVRRAQLLPPASPSVQPGTVFAVTRPKLSAKMLPTRTPSGMVKGSLASVEQALSLYAVKVRL